MTAALVAVCALTPTFISAQGTELPPVLEVRSDLPHMTWPGIEALLTRTDAVIIPVASLEQARGRTRPWGSTTRTA